MIANNWCSSQQEHQSEQYDTSSSDTITNYYKNSVILITGGTGFLGKVLIEKLLRVFDVRKIYILIRHKNNMNADDRLQTLLNESVGLTKKII